MLQPGTGKRDMEPTSRLPEVIVDFECEEDLLFLVIANVGLSSAHQISIQCDKEIRDFRGRQMTEMPILRRLEFMPPERKSGCSSTGSPRTSERNSRCGWNFR